VFQSKAVVFATGGFGKIFKTTSNAHTLTGDGVGIVWRKGLPLEDMEFFQFHPTGLAGLGILLTEGARGEGAILRNASGERFMERYAPTIKDLAPRDIVSRCMVQEVEEGRGAGPTRTTCFWTARTWGRRFSRPSCPTSPSSPARISASTRSSSPSRSCRRRTTRWAGIPTNIEAEVLSDNDTVVPGLYAAGECACVSVHGSNRLGTNSLLDINVFGKRAGRNAVKYVQSGAEFVPLPEDPAREVREMIEGLRNNTGTERIAVLRKTLQDEMDRKAQVFRTDQSLGEVMLVIAELRERYKNVHVDDKGKRYNTDLLEAVELGFLLDIAEVVAVAARNRKESRGGHMRDDYPTRDDENYMKHTMSYLSGDAHSSHPEDHIRLDWKPVVFTKNEAGELRYPPLERKY